MLGAYSLLAFLLGEFIEVEKMKKVEKCIALFKK